MRMPEEVTVAVVAVIATVITQVFIFVRHAYYNDPGIEIVSRPRPVDVVNIGVYIGDARDAVRSHHEGAS